MALFGRKKTTDEAPASPATVPEVEAAPVPAHAPSSPPHDDLDAFDLDAFAQAPATGATTSTTDAFDDLSTPAQDVEGANSGSAFDFPDSGATHATTSGASENDAPDFDKLYEIEQANAAKSAAPAPFVPPTATIQEPATPFYEPQVPVVTESEPQPKKKLPLVPILGALGFLALSGAAASYFANQTESEPEEQATFAVRTKPAPATNPAPASSPAPPVKVVKLKPVPVVVDPLPKGPTNVRPGIAPASDRTAQLKALWRRGADAKHRGDFVSARRFWNQGLKIQPGNVGFKESIAKLPR